MFFIKSHNLPDFSSTVTNILFSCLLITDENESLIIIHCLLLMIVANWPSIPWSIPWFDYCALGRIWSKAFRVKKMTHKKLWFSWARKHSIKPINKLMNLGMALYKIWIETRGSPDIVKTGRLDFSLSWLKGEVRENLGDFRKSNVSFPTTACSPYLSQNKRAA
jgi:hypothetical protein